MGVDEWEVGGAQPGKPGKTCRASSAARLTEQRPVAVAVALALALAGQRSGRSQLSPPVTVPVEEQCSATAACGAVVCWAGLAAGTWTGKMTNLIGHGWAAPARNKLDGAVQLQSKSYGLG